MRFSTNRPKVENRIPFSPLRMSAYGADLQQALLKLSIEASNRSVQEMGPKFFDTRIVSKEEIQREIDAGDKEAGTTERSTSWNGQVLRVDWVEPVSREITIQTGNVRITVASSPIDRIKQKALQARAIVPNAIKEVEAELDWVIAQKSVITEKKLEATAPHKAALGGLVGELEGLKGALDLLSNGGPPLDESETSAPGSQTDT